MTVSIRITYPRSSYLYAYARFEEPVDLVEDVYDYSGAHLGTTLENLK